MALDTDYTVTTFDSYATVAELDALSAAKAVTRATSVAKYDALVDASKEAYAIAATKWIAGFKHLGLISSDVVAPDAMWPRSGLSYPNGVSLSNLSVPDFVKEVQFLRVLDMLDGLAVGSSVNAEAGVKRQKVGPIETEYLGSSVVGLTKATRQTEAYRVLSPYLAASNGLSRT